MVVGEDRVRVEPNGRLQMRGIKSLQIRHRKYSCRMVSGTIQLSKGDPVGIALTLALVALLANGHPSPLSLKQIT